jgi:hypothetical protein
MWIRSLRILPLFVLSIMCLTVASGSVRAEGEAVLLVSHESAPNAVSRKSPIFRTALIAAAGAMLHAKLIPKGAEEVLPKGSYKSKGRNPMKTWLMAAGKANLPAQFLVGLEVIVSVIERSQSQVVEVAVAANSHALPSGGELGEFRMEKPQRFPLPTDCDRKCVVAEATKAVKVVAREAGTAAAAHIENARN